MTADLDFDEIDAVMEQKTRKRNLQAIENSIVNVDVAKRLAAGESVKELALELGVGQETIRKRMRKGALRDLIAIENRRVILHLMKRPLAKEKYLALSTSVGNYVAADQRLRDEDVGPKSQQINIEQLNVLFSRRGREEESDSDGEGIQIVESKTIQRLPENTDTGRDGETDGPVYDGGED